MTELTLIQRAKRKALKKLAPVLRPIRRKFINNTDFTIISNNCWGGLVSDYFGLRKNSPTVGCYFLSEEYIKFVTNLEHYLNTEMHMIEAKDSKNYEKYVALNSGDVPIGVLDDVEVAFQHYRDPKKAKETWKKRVDRVNFENIIFKFSQMNYCEEKHLKAFDEFNFRGKKTKKIMFVNNPRPEFKSAIHYKGYEKENKILNDAYFFKKHLNLYAFINEGKLIQR